MTPVGRHHYIYRTNSRYTHFLSMNRLKPFRWLPKKSLKLSGSMEIRYVSFRRINCAELSKYVRALRPERLGLFKCLSLSSQIYKVTDHLNGLANRPPTVLTRPEMMELQDKKTLKLFYLFSIFFKEA